MSEPTGRAAIGDFFAAYLGIDRPRLVRAAGHKFTDVSVVSPAMMRAVSVINLASVRALEQALGRTLDPLRFRANIYCDGLPAWSELDWVEKEIAIGPVRMRGMLRTRRCAATNVNPRDSGARREPARRPGAQFRPSRHGHLSGGTDRRPGRAQRPYSGIGVKTMQTRSKPETFEPPLSGAYHHLPGRLDGIRAVPVWRPGRPWRRSRADDGRTGSGAEPSPGAAALRTVPRHRPGRISQTTSISPIGDRAPISRPGWPTRRSMRFSGAPSAARSGCGRRAWSRRPAIWTRTACCRATNGASAGT